MKKVLLTAGALLASLFLGGCGEKAEPVTASAGGQPLTIALDRAPDADHVGLYAAQADGEFSRAGLTVSVRTPSTSGTSLDQLAMGAADVAVASEPAVLLARDRGEPLVAVAAILQGPLAALISLPQARVRGPADLRGRRVGVTGAVAERALLGTVLARAGVPPAAVSETDLGAGLLGGLLTHRATAILGARNLEGVALALARKRPRELRIEDLGVPRYDELVLVARKATIVRKAGEIRRFVQALGRAYAAVRAQPEAGLRPLLSADPALGRRLQAAALAQTLPSFFPAAGHPWGWLDPAAWRAFGQWMYSEHLISNPNTLDEAESDDFLAGVGP